MTKPIFITGLPRTGSTLLVNLLAQNPDILVTHGTCPVPDIMFELKNTWHSRKTTQAMPSEISYQLLQNLLRGLLYGAVPTDKPYFITKSRSWLQLLETLNQICDEPPKFLVCVRNLAEILASMELQTRKARVLGMSSQELGAPLETKTIEQRCTYWTAANQLVGSAYINLQDVLQKGYGQQLLFVDMYDLTHSPDATLERIYNFLTIEQFKHNYENIVQVTQEDDRFHGFYDLHSVKPKLIAVENKAVEVLGAKLTEQYNAYNHLWRNN